ncbi:PulJ/GspJ family protein [Chamaesiphon polymorphus]|uniref:Prepilin-type cleavage/methylation domain-containing protein n=1 Tax=Chamaesiphon polymorphus CCALA 037 TaxID=2107692 RepID=A0A2T1FF57_9CYAN|nr:prepilin-type cleavage/methylation domain-containing protein [Chamaesiphon polymorphus]PSB43581.1 prepilin-type cleavage/methylation domain-containing protein [Chamaesiphon polymorphus CCALA 037]
MQLCQHKLFQPNDDRGFSMIEAVVAMMLVTTFITISLQLLLAATAVRVIAREKAEATTWIEADLETVKFRASQYSDSSKCNAIDSSSGYAQGFRDAIPASNGLDAPTDMTLNKTINANNFILTRTANPRTIPPYDVLEIRYHVTSASGLKIAKLYTEVIPHAALNCP